MCELIWFRVERLVEFSKETAPLGDGSPSLFLSLVSRFRRWKKVNSGWNVTFLLAYQSSFMEALEHFPVSKINEQGLIFQKPYFLLFSVTKYTCIEKADTCLQSNVFKVEKGGGGERIKRLFNSGFFTIMVLLISFSVTVFHFSQWISHIAH